MSKGTNFRRKRVAIPRRQQVVWRIGTQHCGAPSPCRHTHLASAASPRQQQKESEIQTRERCLSVLVGSRVPVPAWAACQVSKHVNNKGRQAGRGGKGRVGLAAALGAATRAFWSRGLTQGTVPATYQLSFICLSTTPGVLPVTRTYSKPRTEAYNRRSHLPSTPARRTALSQFRGYTSHAELKRIRQQASLRVR